MQEGQASDTKFVTRMEAEIAGVEGSVRAKMGVGMDKESGMDIGASAGMDAEAGGVVAATR